MNLLGSGGKDVEKVNDLDKQMTLVLGYVIIGAWVVSFLADLVLPHYDPPPTLHALMMIVAGAAFGNYVARGHKDDQ